MKRSVFAALKVFISMGSFAGSAISQELDVPVMERASDGLDTCALGEVTGLKADGDGFLAVRSGPGTGHDKIDELANGDKVWLFDTSGKWQGVVYGVDELSCSPVENTRPVQHPGKKGWIHSNWVRVIAG